uniref:Uncharacterized protein n=1 Tax=viral metagenome TaxID=1070528 RepID=A0A6M3KY28_9ZZZZ
MAYDPDQANKAKRAAHNKKYYEANKVKCAAYHKRYYQANKEKFAAYNKKYGKAYYQANKAKINARRRNNKHYAAYHKEYDKRYYAANREKLLAKAKEKYREKVEAAKKVWDEEEVTTVEEYLVDYAEELGRGDGMVAMRRHCEEIGVQSVAQHEAAIEHCNKLPRVTALQYEFGEEEKETATLLFEHYFAAFMRQANRTFYEYV